MKLIVGLGNVGSNYDLTRHNVGFMVIDNFLGNVSFKDDKFAYTYSAVFNGEKVLFIKPTTYMNLSGNAVQYYANYYKICISDILVIQDDLDLPLGKVRIKSKSTAGGHNGIKSIISSLNSDEFLRLKIGISKSDVNTSDYVLGKFSKEELNTLSDTFNVSKSIINDFINNQGVDSLMRRYN